MTTLTQTPRAHQHNAVTERARGVLGSVDWILLAAVAALSALSLYTIDVATASDFGGSGFYVNRQAVFLVVGVVVLVAAAVFDTERAQGMPWVLLGSLLGALAVVYAIGSTVNGSRRWIDLGPFSMQPSEMGKVLMIVILAGLALERVGEMEPGRLTLFLGGITVVPAIVVFLQPDLGTALVYFAVYIGVLVMILTPWQHFAVMGAGLVAVVLVVMVVLPAVGLPVLKEYQQGRLTSFIDPTADPDGTGYQINQAKIAIGSGGAAGKGREGATQATNEFLPEHQTDFIFAVVGEVFGFVGTAGVVALFGIIIWRALRITARAATQFEQVVAGGLATLFIFQAFVNIGMNIGIMPVTGIPLPFMSYGGSHTLTNMGAIGILLAINRRRVGI